MPDELPDLIPDLTPAMKAAIGKPGAPVTYEVTTLGIRTFARAVGYKNPIYYDAAAAKAAGHKDLVAPPGYFGMPIFDPNAPVSLGTTFDSPFKRVLAGGTEVAPVERIYAGDVLEGVTTLVDLKLERGRLGQMLISTYEMVYTRKADGKVVARTRRTGVAY